MKKILMVACNNLALGGIQNVIMNIVRHLSDEYRFDIVCFDKAKCHYDDEFQSYGGSIFRIPFYSGESVIRRKLDFYLRGHYLACSIKAVIQEHGPYDAIHCHNMNESGIVLKQAYQCGIPIRISHAHTALPKKYNCIAKIYVAWLKKCINTYATDKIACSTIAGDTLFGQGVSKTIYNTVDEKFFEEPSSNKQHSKAPALLQVGLFCENKNQAFSVDVLYHIRKCYPDATLTLIGRAPGLEYERYVGTIKSGIKERGLEDGVAFLPADADVFNNMMKADYLLLPSQFEGLPVVLIEAQACGMHCFASDSVPKEVDCGGCTFLPLSKEAEYWAKEICEEYVLHHGAHTPHDMTRFCTDVVMDQYRNLYAGETT